MHELKDPRATEQFVSLTEPRTAVAAILRDRSLIARWRSGRPLCSATA